MVLGATLFFVWLGNLPLIEPDEGRNAEVAREMLASGDWITPHYDTLPYLDKPPVFFWLAAASFRVAGVSEWAARFTSALAALGTLLLTWFLARRMFNGAVPLRAGTVFATCPLVIILARLVIFDMTLAFFITAALMSYWMARQAQRRASKTLSAVEGWWDAGFFAAMGLASITKGPVGFILPLLTVSAFEAARGRPGELKRLRWLSGLAVFFLIALPWLVVVSVRNPSFPRYAFWEESIVRFTAGGVRRGGSVLYYVPVFFGGLFPWSLFLFFAALNRLSRWKELRDDKQAPVLYLLIWSAVVLVFFSISHSKLPAYFLPACVPLSILMARAWSEPDFVPQPTDAPDWLTAGFAALMALGLVTALAFWLPIHFAWLERLGRAKIPPQALAQVRPSLAYTGMILAGWGILGRKLASSKGWRGPAHTGWLTLAIAALVAPSLFLRWARPIRTYAEFASSRQLARTLLSSPQKDLTVYGFYYFRTSLPFYLKRPVGLVTGGGGELTSNYIASHLDGARSGAAGRELLLDYQSFYSKAQTSSQPFLVLARNSHVASLGKATGRAEDLTPLWAEWQDSVWGVPAARLPSPARPNSGP